jgi:hypothetical protein
VACWGFGNNRRVMTGHFLKRYLAREYPIRAALLAAFAFRALVLAFLLPNPLCHSPPTLLAGGIEMAPKRKAASSSAAVIPPIDPNSQLPFAGSHMSIISEAELLHLVSIGVLSPRYSPERQLWMSRNPSVLARGALTEPVSLSLLLMSKRRKEDASGEYPVLMRTLVLQFLLLKKCLRLGLLTLTPMGVPKLLLIPMWVLHLLLIPMGVLLVLLIPMGVLLVLLVPMGVLLVLSLWKMRRKKMRLL